jgi:pimeloyl-ACP methyl ester carboxylesterase
VDADTTLLLVSGRTWSTLPVFDLVYRVKGDDQCDMLYEDELLVEISGGASSSSSSSSEPSALPDCERTYTVNLSTMDRLVKQGVRVFAVDMRGGGGTPRDESGWLTPATCVSDILDVTKWLEGAHNVRKPALLGWSQGGLVCQVLTLTLPHLSLFLSSLFSLWTGHLTSYFSLDVNVNVNVIHLI